MRFALGSALVFLAFSTASVNQNNVITPQHLELPSGYPHVARAARLQGTIAVNLTVSGDGRVIAVEANSSDAVLKAHPILQADAANLSREWKFACSNCAKESTHPCELIFTYRLEGKESANSDTQVAVDLPNHVTVTAASSNCNGRLVGLPDMCR
jgi:TonB family protein